MEDLRKSYGVNPIDFCAATPDLDSMHLTTTQKLATLSVSKALDDKLRSTSLRMDEQNYIKSLILKLSFMYDSVGNVRDAIDSKKSIFEADNFDINADTVITKRLFAIV